MENKKDELIQNLYAHRNALFTLVVKIVVNDGDGWNVYKSRRHADGSNVEIGWFVVSMELGNTGKTISYHLPLKYWFCMKAIEVEKIPEFDGHTSTDVIARIESFLELRPFSNSTFFPGEINENCKM